MHSSSEDHAFSLADEMQIGAAGAETFWRFRQLMLHGYKPNYEHSREDAFWFEHPRKSFAHRSVALYSTGVVRSIFAREDTVFERWDKEGFADFLRNVLHPNWWERSRETRQKIYTVIFAVILYSLLFLGIRIVTGMFK
ncbi:hypothetical protein [Bradyrhizobium zhanjiangense]|uniref:hypothetical protein n=1 Tax=Bradyrhizobium zhanjiangense TaxID=1325107 RepID=UPI0010088DBD|nr:hypothetical protein [Bradyrhizobium zhanjiangense]